MVINYHTSLILKTVFYVWYFYYWYITWIDILVQLFSNLFCSVYNCRNRPVGHLAWSIDGLISELHWQLVPMLQSIEMTAEGWTIQPPLVLPGWFCEGRPYGRFGQPGHLQPVRGVDDYCWKASTKRVEPENSILDKNSWVGIWKGYCKLY